MRRSGRHYVTAVTAVLLLGLAACGEASPDPSEDEAMGDEAEDTADDSDDDSEAASDGDYPSEDVDFTIAFGPGGGNDIMARTLIDIIQQYDLYPAGTIVPTNREGGSGANGWGYLYEQAGDPYHLSTTSSSYIATPLTADVPFGPQDFTPVAMLASDDVLLIVEGSSDFESIEQFVEYAQENPVTIGAVGASGSDYIIPTLLAEETEWSDFEYVAFNEAGQRDSALLSGAVDAIMADPVEVVGQIDSGDVRALAFAGSETPDALGVDVPTLGDLYGIQEVPKARGLIMPPDVSEEAQQWWIDTIQEVVETPEWQEFIATNVLTENVQYGDDFAQILDDVTELYSDALDETG